MKLTNIDFEKLENKIIGKDKKFWYFFGYDGLFELDNLNKEFKLEFMSYILDYFCGDNNISKLFVNDKKPKTFNTTEQKASIIKSISVPEKRDTIIKIMNDSNGKNFSYIEELFIRNFIGDVLYYVSNCGFNAMIKETDFGTTIYIDKCNKTSENFMDLSIRNQTLKVIHLYKNKCLTESTNEILIISDMVGYQFNKTNALKTINSWLLNGINSNPETENLFSIKKPTN